MRADAPESEAGEKRLDAGLLLERDVEEMRGMLQSMDKKKAAKRRAASSQPGRGLVEEVLEPASSSFSPSHAPR